MKKNKLLGLFLFITNLSIGQIRDFQSYGFLKGFNEWEKIQAECSMIVEIDPLMNQSSYLLTKKLNIKVVREFIDDTINGKHLSYIHHYDTNGSLSKTQTQLFKNSAGELLPTIELVYHYNAKFNLDSLEIKQQHALIDPNELMPLLYHGFSNYNVYVDETCNFEVYREYFPSFAKGEFLRLIEYNKLDLISKVIYKENGAIVRQYIYEYDFY